MPATAVMFPGQGARRIARLLEECGLTRTHLVADLVEQSLPAAGVSPPNSSAPHGK